MEVPKGLCRKVRLRVKANIKPPTRHPVSEGVANNMTLRILRVKASSKIGEPS